MRTLFLVAILALAAIPPFALADGSTCDPTATACVTESNYVDGSCGQGSGFEMHSTTISAGPAQVQGSSYCSEGGGFGQSGTTDSVTVAGQGISMSSFAYNDPDVGQGSGCSVLIGPAFASCAPLGAPDPGWGHVLG